MLCRRILLFFFLFSCIAKSASAEDGEITFSQSCIPGGLLAMQAILEKNVGELLKTDANLTNVRVTVRPKLIAPSKENVTLKHLVEGLDFFIDKSPSADYAVKVTGAAQNISCIAKVKFITTIYANKKGAKQRTVSRSESVVDVPGVVLLGRPIPFSN